MAKTIHDYKTHGQHMFRRGEPRPHTTERASWQAKAMADGWEAAQLHAEATAIRNRAATPAPVEVIRYNGQRLTEAALRRRSRRIEHMVQGFIAAAHFFTTGTHPRTGEDLEDLQEFEPSSATRERALDYCREFYDSNHSDLAAYVAHEGPVHDSTALRGYEHAGHDLWLTQAGHGVGFWGRGMKGIGERLTYAVKAAGEVEIYLGDDMQTHFRLA